MVAMWCTELYYASCEEQTERARKCITECWAQGFGSPPSNSCMCSLTHSAEGIPIFPAAQWWPPPSSRVTLFLLRQWFSCRPGMTGAGRRNGEHHTFHLVCVCCVCVCLYFKKKKKKDRMWTGGCVVDWVSAQLEKQKELKHLSFFLFYFYTSFTLRYCLVVLPPLLFFLTKHHHICRQTPTLVRFFYRAREHPILMLQLQKLHSALTLIAINMWPRAS